MGGAAAGQLAPPSSSPVCRQPWRPSPRCVWGFLRTQMWTVGQKGLCLKLSLGQSGNSTVYWATVEMHAIFLVVGLQGRLYLFFVD